MVIQDFSPSYNIAYALTWTPDRGNNYPVMSVLTSIKDIVVGQAMRLAGNPRVSKLASDPRLMNMAMKALSLGGSVKSGMDKAGGMAAGVLGLATQQEISSLRATIAQLEDTVSVLEAKTAASKPPTAL
jgi:hypothetical protein